MRTTQGIVPVSDAEFRVASYDWSFARDDAARIDAHWAEQCHLKPQLYDGRVLLAREVEVVSGRLHGVCFETSFKRFLAWRDFGFPGAPVANFFAMGALVSADGAFMLGEMSAGTSNAGLLYFPAGTPEPADLKPDGRVDLQASILREVAEETGFTGGDVVFEGSWTIVFDGPRVGCMRRLRAKETAAALQSRFLTFNGRQANPELAKLVPVRTLAEIDPERMPNFMCRYLREML